MGLSALIDIIYQLILPLLNQFFLGILLLLVGIIIGRIASMFVQKFLHSAHINTLAAKTTGTKAPIEQIFSHFVRYLTYSLFLIAALNTIGLTSIILTGIGLGILIVLVISLFLSIKDFLPNAISGLRLMRKGMLKKGDHILFETFRGEVMGINLTETELRTAEGDSLFVPNRLLLNRQIKKQKRR